MKKILVFLSALILVCFAFFSPVGAGGSSPFPAAASETKSDIDGEARERRLPILMYHSVLPSEKGVYFVSPEQLEEDLRELKRRGYESVSVYEVKRFLKGKGCLPEKPVMITFDDGHYNNLFYAAEILKKYDFSAVLHVIGCFTEYSSTHEKDVPEYSHLTWEEVGELYRSGVFEIGSHSYAMHSYKPRFGIKQMKGESDEDYEGALRADTLRLEKALLEKSGVIPVSYAFPFGAYDDRSRAILSSLGYEVFFTCYEKINLLHFGDEAKLSRLNRINRNGTLSTSAFFSAHGIL